MKHFLKGWHGGAVVSMAASSQEGPAFESTDCLGHFLDVCSSIVCVFFSLIALASFHSLKTCILGYLVAHMNVCLSLCVSPDLVLPYDSWGRLHSDAIHPFTSIYRSEWMDATRPFELQIYKVH